ncbi:MAG TPA: hypothetical protein H9939_08430, partial [Candidatus Barnesiella merdigallinarum]|nr:hypothetical protein [Candidatus Barnesiella merdigallinarum]
TPHPDAGSRKEKALETVAGITYANNFASIPGYRVVARYDKKKAADVTICHRHLKKERIDAVRNYLTTTFHEQSLIRTT